MALLLVLLGAGCAAPVPPRPTPTPTLAPLPVAPTSNATPTPASNARPTPSVEPTDVADPADVARAFLSEVSAATDEAIALASAPCDELKTELQTNPSELPSLRGFAATLKQLARQEADLDTDDVRNAMTDLDQAMAELQGALSLCGLNPT
jgi:hypothetical protein